MKKKEVDEKTGLWKEPDPVEHSDAYYDYKRNDPNAENSAASLDIKVGSCLDPRPYHGVAHLLEHMLAQGNKKYPHENDF